MTNVDLRLHLRLVVLGRWLRAQNEEVGQLNKKSQRSFLYRWPGSQATPATTNCQDQCEAAIATQDFHES